MSKAGALTEKQVAFLNTRAKYEDYLFRAGETIDELGAREGLSVGNIRSWEKVLRREKSSPSEGRINDLEDEIDKLDETIEKAEETGRDTTALENRKELLEEKLGELTIF